MVMMIVVVIVVVVMVVVVAVVVVVVVVVGDVDIGRVITIVTLLIIFVSMFLSSISKLLSAAVRNGMQYVTPVAHTVHSTSLTFRSSLS